jgi:hypothetical protein
MAPRAAFAGVIITFPVDCDITGPTCTSVPSVGSITLTQNPDGTSVDAAVSLSGGESISELYLNFNPVLSNSGWSFTGTVPDSFNTTADTRKADGWDGAFDIELKWTSGAIEPFIVTISKSGTTLTPDDFLFTDFGGTGTDGDGNPLDLYAAMKVGSGHSYFASASSESGSDDIIPVPEPSVLSLFATGAAGLIASKRQRRMRPREKNLRLPQTGDDRTLMRA